MATIGEVCETGGEITIQWKIKDFSSLSQEMDKFYDSPKFYFSGASWKLRIYPSGMTQYKTGDWVGLYLVRALAGTPITLDYSFRTKTENDERHLEQSNTWTFYEEEKGFGTAKYASKTFLQEKKDELIPSDVLTILCTLKCDKPRVIAGSLFNRYAELSDTMKKIYKKKTRTDAVLKVDGKNIPVHRMILEERSPVFAAMFRHDMKENVRGEISIKDIEKSTMEVILEYLYTGDMVQLTTENALPIYAAADKYDVKLIKEMSSEFIKRNISLDWVCDVIKFAQLYEDKEIVSRAREYFKENAREIMKTEKWKTFAEENVSIILELYGTVLLSLLPE